MSRLSTVGRQRALPCAHQRSTRCDTALKKILATLQNCRSPNLNLRASIINQLNRVAGKETTTERGAVFQSVISKNRENPLCQLPTTRQFSTCCSVRNFFAPLRTFSMEMESTSNLVAPQDGNKKSMRLPSIILTSPVNIVSFQHSIKPIAQDYFY